MIRLPSILTALAALGAAALGQPAAAALPQATADGLIEAAQICTKANGASFNEAALLADGWKSGTMRTADGEEADTPLGFYSRDSGDPLIVATPAKDGANSNCALMATIGEKGSEDGEDAIRARFAETFGMATAAGDRTVHRQGSDLIVLTFVSADGDTAPRTQILIIEPGD